MARPTHPLFFRLLIAAAAILALVVSACRSDSEPAARRDIGPKRVQVAAVEPATASRTLRFSGTVRSSERGTLAFQVPGRVASRPVAVGERVRGGQVLATLDSREASNGVAAAEAALAEVVARREQGALQLQRIRELVAAGAATPEELESVEANAAIVFAAQDAAEARLREARRLRDEVTLRAPYDATVVEVFLEPGEQAIPGRPVLSLAGDGSAELEVEIPESLVDAVREGDTLEVEVARSGDTVSGRVEQVARAAAGTGRLYPVTVRLPGDAGVPIGAVAELVVPLSIGDALTVPVEAVVDPGGRRPVVFRLGAGSTGDRASAAVEKVPVEVGVLSEGRVVVRHTSDSAPLEAGDRVVVGGQRGLLDGEPVRIDSGEGGAADGTGLAR